MGGDALDVRLLISDDFSPQNSFFLTEVVFIMAIKVLRKPFHLLSSCHVDELSPKVERLTFSSFRKNTEN